MPHWLIKSAIHRTISLLPYSQRWNAWLQQHVTRSLDLDATEFEWKLAMCRRFVEDHLAFRQAGHAAFTAVEIGTGWYPIVPIGLYLCGASAIWTFDVDPLLRLDRVQTVLRMYDEYSRRGALRSLLPQVQAERLVRLREAVATGHADVRALLAALNIHARVQDARRTGLETGSVNLVFSYSVLEYIPAPVLGGILAEFHRVLRREGTMVHYINLLDQFSRFDTSITPINFLKFSSGQWRWLGSPLIPLTRLRMSEYRELLSSAGFEIRKLTTTSAPADMLREIELAPEFRRFEQSDLLVLTAWLVATTR